MAPPSRGSVSKEMFPYKRPKGVRTKRESRSVDLTGLVRATSTTGGTSLTASVMPDRVSTVLACAGTKTVTPSLPMLARPVHRFDGLATVLSSDACIYEDKYDGERLICAIDHRGSSFFTRTLKPTTFPHEVTLKPGYADCVLDGERVYADPATGTLVPICDTGTRSNLIQGYRVFDVQYVNGVQMFGTPLHERKRLLAACLQESRAVQLAPYAACSSPESLRRTFHEQVVMRPGKEGLLVKPMNSVYVPDCRKHWLKLKTLHLTEYKEEYDLYAHRALKDKDGVYGVLECGYYSPDTSEFIHVCRVGSGFSAAIRNHIGLSVDPGTGLFRRRTVVSLKADKITEHNRSLRHPSVLAFKLDRTAIDVSRFQKT